MTTTWHQLQTMCVWLLLYWSTQPVAFMAKFLLNSCRKTRKFLVLE
jgi:hypothetical protein